MQYVSNTINGSLLEAEGEIDGAKTIRLDSVVVEVCSADEFYTRIQEYERGTAKSKLWPCDECGDPVPVDELMADDYERKNYCPHCASSDEYLLSRTPKAALEFIVNRCKSAYRIGSERTRTARQDAIDSELRELLREVGPQQLVKIYDHVGGISNLHRAAIEALEEMS